MLKERFEKGTSAGVDQYIITIPDELNGNSAIQNITIFLEDNCPASEGATAEVQAMVDGEVGNFKFACSDNGWAVIPPVGFSAGGGGGGGGDIATITIVNNTDFNWTLKGAFAISQGGMTASYYEIDSNVFPIEGGDYGVFLYGGHAIVTLIPDAHHHVEWSGDAAPSGGGYLVTGDCTVTLTA